MKSGGTLRNVYIMGRNLPKISSIRSNKINNKNLHCFYQATGEQWTQQFLGHHPDLEIQSRSKLWSTSPQNYFLVNQGLYFDKSV